MLKYTGHPLIDVGAATIAAFAGKRDPNLLMAADLHKVAYYIERNYTRPPLQGFLQGAVFPNSGYTNPGIRGERHSYLAPVLYAYAQPAPEGSEPCVCCGQPSALRVARDYFPLLSGRDVINYYPWGDSGLPLCGKCLLCLQAYPLGAGRLMLVVHSDSREITEYFASRFLEENRMALLLAQSAKDKKVFRDRRSFRTLLMETLLQADRMQRMEQREDMPFSITAYLVSNNGQSPTVDIYHLPLELIGFLRGVTAPECRQAWNTIVARGWRLSQPRKGKKGDEGKADDDTRPRQNVLYEDLFRLPEQAHRFIRRYFLRMPARAGSEGDPRRSYSTREEAQLVSWPLTELFLRKVVAMDKERIALIRDFGDRLAAYVSEENDRAFFNAFYAERKYYLFRNALIRANLAWIQSGHEPLVRFEPYVEVFEEGSEVAYHDWTLVRDLVLIRMVEQLYAQGWLGSNQDALAEIETAEEPDEAPADS